MNKRLYVPIAVSPATRQKLRKLAKEMKTNIKYTVDILAENELKKILNKNINIDNQ